MTARADFAFLHPLRIRRTERDAQGVVVNADYFLYDGIAVSEFARGLESA